MAPRPSQSTVSMEAVVSAQEITVMPASQPAADESSTSMALMIERLASNPQVDVAKLTAIIDLQERVAARDAEGAFNRAFAAMQKDIPVIVERGKADRGNGGTYTYARFEDVMRALRPDVHAKGTDYTADSIPEKAVAQERRGRGKIFLIADLGDRQVELCLKESYTISAALVASVRATPGVVDVQEI